MERGTARVRVPRRDGRGYGRGVMKWVRDQVRRHGGKLSLLVGVMLLGAAVGLIVAYWCWLTDGQAGSTAVRNVGLVLGGAIALWIAGWRAVVADRHAGTAQADLLNKRYRESAEMLGSEMLAVRLAGIHALRRLAEEHAEECHIQAMRLLATLVRHPGSDPRGMAIGGRREDVEIAIRAISACREQQHNTDLARGVDLQKADLRWALLQSVNLSSAPVPEALMDLDLRRLPPPELAELTHVNLMLADLLGARLDHARLRRAILMGSNLAGTTLEGADLSGTFLSSGAPPTRGLTQVQLDRALADPEDPPKLDGVKDADTGKQLVWRGRTLDGEPHPNPPPIPDA